MYAFLLKWDPMRTPQFTGVRIGSHLNKNAYMQEQTIGIHKEVGIMHMECALTFFAIFLTNPFLENDMFLFVLAYQNMRLNILSGC